MCVCVCVCVWTLPSIYMSKMSGRNHENLTTNFNCIYCQNFSMKTKFILDLYIYIYILITLVGLHSTHALNYTRNIKNKNKNLHTKHQKTFSSSFSRSLLNTGKLNSFLKNVLWKMNHFPKNVYAKTNRDRRSNSNV